MTNQSRQLSLALVAALSLAACARDDTDPNATAIEAPSAAPTDTEPPTSAPDLEPADPIATASTTTSTTTAPMPSDPASHTDTTTPAPAAAEPDGAAADTVAADSTTAGTSSATVASTTTEPPNDPAIECVQQLSLRDRAALVTWPAVYSNDWNSARSIVRDQHVGGVLLMKPQGWTRGDLEAGLAELDAISRNGIVVSTDEEGGVVQRLEFIADLPSQNDVSTSLDPAAAQAMIAAHGQTVAAVGVDMVLGPVVDVAPTNGDVPLSRSRFFEGDADTVTAYADAYIEGWQSNGLATVLKHFPGHGAASGDTHVAVGLTPPLDQLATWDLVPYQQLASRGTAVMIGHLTVPGLTGDLPATQSPGAIDYLRGELGYGDALVISDALGMDAVGLDEPQAAVAALRAGIDVALFTASSRTSAVIDALVAAVEDGTLAAGRLDEAARRVMRQLQSQGDGC